MKSSSLDDLADMISALHSGTRFATGYHSNVFLFRLAYPVRMVLIFEVRDSEEGGYCARALGHAIFTEAETWKELRENVLEAAALHFADAALRPRMVPLHYVKDELIPVEAA
jgi:hypothetical protein